MPYWDSKGAAEKLFAKPKNLVRLGLRDRFPREYFAGRWEDRNRLNVPGPFYGAETDTCCCGPSAAPNNVLVDDNDQEFVWRQPRASDELRGVLDAAWQDPFTGYAWDGDEHWTVETVREWWRDRAEVTTWIDDRLRDESFLTGQGDDRQAVAASLDEFRAHIRGPLAANLREYLFWLVERRPARGHEVLPPL
jgi:hypothetical protein